MKNLKQCSFLVISDKVSVYLQYLPKFYIYNVLSPPLVKTRFGDLIFIPEIYPLNLHMSEPICSMFALWTIWNGWDFYIFIDKHRLIFSVYLWKRCVNFEKIRICIQKENVNIAWTKLAKIGLTWFTLAQEKHTKAWIFFFNCAIDVCPTHCNIYFNLNSTT